MLLIDLLTFVVFLMLVAVAAEAVTEIMVSSALLDVIGLRPWAARRAIPTNPANIGAVRWYHTAIFKLLTCGYCTSVWVAGALAWTVPGCYFNLLPWDNIVVKWMLVHRLAKTWHAIYQVLWRGRVNTVDLTVTVPDADPATPTKTTDAR